MSDNITKRVGLGTAYGFAKAGGYEGTVAEFTELLGNIAIDLARIENLSVTVTTLPAGSQATASLNGSVLSLGIPKGDKGDKGNTGDTGSPAGFGTVSATVDANIGTPSVEVTASGADTAKNFAFAFHNLKGQKGDKGDTGEVSEAELAEALENFAENGTVANAEQLTTKIRANDQTPYLFRTSGGSVDIGDREYINGIVGGTVAWNQLVQNGDFANGTNKWSSAKGTISVSDGVLTFTNTDVPTSAYSNRIIQNATTNLVITNHTYVWLGMIRSSRAVEVTGSLTGCTNANSASIHIVASANKWEERGMILKANESLHHETQVYYSNDYANVQVGDTLEVKNIMVIDLTQLFSSTIADYIYSLETATAGAGVAFFKSLFPKPYYAYNSGELKSVKGLVSHDMVGFNAWDEEWEKGYYNTSGAPAANNDAIRSKNYIPCVPSTTYYYYNGSIDSGGRICYFDGDKNFISAETGCNRTITTPSNCYYMLFSTPTQYGGTYQNDICINLSWDGSEDGNYEPYQKWSYPLDSSLELRGIPKLDASNNLYYDGDVYEPDGTVTRKYGIVDLGTLTWGYSGGTDARFYSTGLINAKAVPSATVPNMMCGKLRAIKFVDFYADTTVDKTISYYTTDNYLFARDLSTTSPATFKASVSGVYLVYELATPTTETADPYTSPQIVNDFGTEEFVIDDTIDVPIPVGNNTDYPVDLKAKVEMSPNSPDGDGDYIVRQTNGTNEYVAFANNATIQNILSRLEALEG